VTQFTMKYDENGATQENVSPTANNDNQASSDEDRGRDKDRNQRGEIRIRIPSILKSAAVFAAGAVVLFTFETYAPEPYRISTLMGTYDARIAAAVKSAELQQQARFDAWAAQTKIAADQQAEQYRAVTQGVLANYTATYDRGKILTQAAMEVQGRYSATVIGEKTQEQGVDLGIINLVRGWGRFANAMEPGAGESALGYANDLGGSLRKEITDVARESAATPIAMWGTGIASPSEVAATLASIKPLQLPPPPTIGEKRPALAAYPTPGR
jgi:hypothetical protein